MANKFNFNNFVGFLKTFWGGIAALSVLLPSLIHFLNTQQIKESALAGYYLGIPITFALLTIPFLFLSFDKFNNLEKVKRTSLSLFILSLVLIFSFVAIKSFYIVDNTKTDSTGKYITERSNGFIYKGETKEIWVEAYQEWQTKRTLKTKYINSLEYLSLLIYSLSIIFITAVFTILGIYFYQNNGD